MRPPIVVAIVTCGLGLAVAGCGGADQGSAPPAATAATTASTGAAAQSAAADLRGVAIAVRRDPG